MVHVTDSVTSGHNYAGAFHFADGADETVEYEYDENGNMTKDLNRNISSISYNLLNLPSMISFGDNSFIKYTYSATGEKLGVEYGVRLQPVLSPTGQDATMSENGDADGTMRDRSGGFDPGTLVPIAMDGITYCGNVVYDGNDARLLTDEGYVTFTATGTPQYHYYLRDHLGNIRVVMGQTGELEQVNHYYAYGGLMRESTNPGVQPYKYGGKELDRTSGLDAYDFGARMYFADRMQWGTVDPLCEKYYSVSPYAYCENNPIRKKDPFGMKWEDISMIENIKSSIDKTIDHLSSEINEYSFKLSNNTLSERKKAKYERRINENQERIHCMEKTKEDIDFLGDEEEVVFRIVDNKNSIGYVMNNNGIIEVISSTEDLFIHEITHIIQAWKQGEMRFSNNRLLNPGIYMPASKRFEKAAMNEVEAYKRQYAFKPDSYPGKVKSINDINVFSVGKIRTETGDLLYNYIKTYSDYLKRIPK